MEGIDEENASAINISDVIEVIETMDPDFGLMDSGRNNEAYVTIMEQPSSKTRFSEEGKPSENVFGVKSNSDNITYPTIQIVGLKGMAAVVVSCVTVDAPYKPHPNQIVGKKNCSKGVCCVAANSNSPVVTFRDIRIQRARNIEESLNLRQEIKVNPFQTSLSKMDLSSIDLNAVRLCFHVFEEESGSYKKPLQPVVSEPVYNFELLNMDMAFESVDVGLNESQVLPYVTILEQPASNVVKFIEEGLPPEGLIGANSSLENKTFPTIQIVGHEGKKAVVVVSCITKDLPYRPHPHVLVGMEGCKNGVLSAIIDNESMTMAFTNLCIQYVKEKDSVDSLNLRQTIQVDPFQTGFSHKTLGSGLDLDSVRLCFQVFIESRPGRFKTQLQPIVSDPIYNTRLRRNSPFGMSLENGNSAYVKILEQPASKALRFRYECEGRSAGSLPGVNSTAEKKSYPTLQIIGYKGRAMVVVSCVTKDQPYKPHPHNLVGKEGCKDGICTVEVNNDNMIVSFANLGIQCVKKKDIEEALALRKKKQVDPFRTGFQHRTQASSIDLNSVRLCFQVIIKENGKLVPLQPVVSDPIYDKKAIADLEICSLSHSSGSCAGGDKIILLCEKVSKDDITVRFFEELNGRIVWDKDADYTQVHKQVAITFKTPQYKSLEIEEPVQVLVQLRRRSDGATSDALPFEIRPIDSVPSEHLRKRKRMGTNSEVFRQLQENDKKNIPDLGSLGIKGEPDTSPNPYVVYSAALGASVSPVYSSRTPSPSGGVVYQHNFISPAGATGGTTYQPYLTGAPIATLQPITELFNMDDQQCDINSLAQLNSKDLTELNTLDAGNLSANFSANLSLSENMRTSEANMSDSFTTLAKKTINELCGTDS